MQHGFTIIETCVAAAVCVVGAAVVQPVLSGVGEPSKRFKDADQLRQILDAHMMWAANTRKMTYPLPGEIDRFATTIDVGQEGNPDIAVQLNTTGDTLSILIFNGFITPEIVVSPAEVNGLVHAYDDYEYRNPEAAQIPQLALWDPAFHGTPISTHNIGTQNNPTDIGNNSYAQNPALGKRTPLWGLTADPDHVVLGNRGPIYQGQADLGWQLKNGNGGTNSNSLEFYGDIGAWRGNVAYNDGRVEFETQAAPDDLIWHFPDLPEPGDWPDNIYHNEDMAGDEQSEFVGVGGESSISGFRHFESSDADVNAFLRPVAGVTGIEGNLGTVTTWID